jgi:flagellar basal-body rod protein FlgF
MEHGLYAAYLGMKSRQQALDVMANNIANASTNGFKAERMRYESVEAAEIEAKVSILPPNQLSNGNNQTASVSDTNAVDPSLASNHGRFVGVVGNSSSDYSLGTIQQSGRSLDIALDGEGFLAVQTSKGERYTRAGSLKLDSAGQLVTGSGDLVIGKKGPITLPTSEVSISENGTISAKGQVIDQLKIVRFDNPTTTLYKEGSLLFASNQTPQADTKTRVLQNNLELSNVNAVSEMAAMMQNTREFESLQKSVTLIMSDLGRKVANEIGKL